MLWWERSAKSARGAQWNRFRSTGKGENWGSIIKPIKGLIAYYPNLVAMPSLMTSDLMSLVTVVVASRPPSISILLDWRKTELSGATMIVATVEAWCNMGDGWRLAKLDIKGDATAASDATVVCLVEDEEKEVAWKKLTFLVFNRAENELSTNPLRPNLIELWVLNPFWGGPLNI